jgi:GH15 family glucan-1,4-alpha-glucosidase
MQQPQPTLELAVLGNCSIAALVDERARIVWCCIPRLDGDPAFCNLLGGDKLADDGLWDIELLDFATSSQRYIPNSAILETILEDNRGGAIKIIDFIPRFYRHRRTFRPVSIVRLIEPLRGVPRIRVRLRPRYDYGEHEATMTRGSNHIRYLLGSEVLRLTTDAPPSLIRSETPFVLERPLTMVLGADEPVTDLALIGVDWYEQTLEYWRDWTRQLALPFEWQEAVIRAAITLKVCSYEETGGIVAALTTSVPEYADSGRNWDYRYCWLRDTFFVVQTLNRLSVTRTMENYISYITNIVTGWDEGPLQPIFGIGLETHLTEHELDHLPGYRGMGPVRTGNGAYDQIQNDGYGSVILAVAQSFFDQRLARPGGVGLFKQLERLGEEAARRWIEPDAGLWEFRTRAEVHTHSSVMCWAACDRLHRIAERLGLHDRAEIWRDRAQRMHAGIWERAWNEKRSSFVATFDGEDLDGSLLLLQELGFVRADDPRFLSTLKAIESELREGDHLFRYRRADDFGPPEISFVICSFWLVEALAAVGRRAEAREIFERLLSHRSKLGLLSEGIDPKSGALWGNFPQSYSMVGLIRAAIRLSTAWEDAF